MPRNRKRRVEMTTTPGAGVDVTISQRQERKGGYNNNRSSSSRPQSSGVISRLAGQPFYPVSNSMQLTEPVALHTLRDGSVSSTPYGRDPYSGNKVEVCTLEWQFSSFDSFSSNGATTNVGAIACQNRVKNYFQMFVNALNYKGRFTPNQILTAVGDFATYINNYHKAFSGLWTILSISEGIDLNPSMRLFAQGVGIGGILDRTVLNWRRLQSLPIPPKLPTELFNKLSGVFFADDSSPVYTANLNASTSSATITDYSSSTSVGTLLTNVEIALAAMETNTAESNIVQQVLGALFGEPRPLPTPAVWRDPTLWDMLFTKCSTILNTTSALLIVEPYSVAGTLPVPILERKGMSNDLLFTLLRQEPFSSSAGDIATRETIGIINGANTGNSFSRIFGAPFPGAGGGVLNSQQATAAFGTYNFSTPSFFELEWWYLLANSSATDLPTFGADSRMYDRWDKHLMPDYRLATNTIAWLDYLFLSDVKV